MNKAGAGVNAGMKEAYEATMEAVAIVLTETMCSSFDVQAKTDEAWAKAKLHGERAEKQARERFL
jgi:hypothetical protein